MPRQNDYDNTYPDKLKSIGLLLLEPFRGAKQHHQIQCCSCSHVWSATLISKLQAHKKYGSCGCPICYKNQRESEYVAKRLLFLQKIKDRGFILTTPDYDSNQHQRTKITVTNIKCNHTFDVLPRNIISRDVNCPTCNKAQKIQTLNNSSHTRSDIWKETASEWKIYKSYVTKLTRSTYLIHKLTINPNNLPQGKAGIDGAYHLDHIVPIRYCFIHNIPGELCAHQDNLQLLGWRENVGSRDNLKSFIPSIFDAYIKH